MTTLAHRWATVGPTSDFLFAHLFTMNVRGRRNGDCIIDVTVTFVINLALQVPKNAHDHM